MPKRNTLTFLCLAALALAIALLYAPFLSNGLVFDDHNVLSNLSLYDDAILPFSSRPRTFPYFTLGFVQVMFGSIEAQRIVSLILHIACALLLFALLKRLLELTRGELPVSDQPKLHIGHEPRQSSSRAQRGDLGLLRLRLAMTQRVVYGKDAAPSASRYLLPLFGAAWFALNPVAVYGAAYLVERTIVLATLFSLACLWLFVRAFSTRSTTDIVAAAVLYSAAIFCKEHAIMLPLGALPLIALAGTGDRSWKLRRAWLFLLLCLPAGVTVILSVKSVIGKSYEPYVGDIIAQLKMMALFRSPAGVWLASMAMQAREFFLYIHLWLVPDPRSMSVDIRVDFLKIMHSPSLVLGAAAFLAAPALGIYCLWRRGAAALFGCGLLLSWLLYMTELSAVRLQEPFVLYRSYLWAPGFAMMLVAVLSRLRWQWLLVVLIAVLPLEFSLAQDRLRSFVSERALWDDAAAKLSAADLPGADRIYNNRGDARLKRGELAAAMKDFDRVVALNPDADYGYLGRSAIYYQEKNYAQALAELDHALRLKPNSADSGNILYRRGNVLEALGRRAEALSAYRAAAKAGYSLAKFRLEYLGKS